MFMFAEPCNFDVNRNTAAMLPKQNKDKKNQKKTKKFVRFTRLRVGLHARIDEPAKMSKTEQKKSVTATLVPKN